MSEYSEKRCAVLGLARAGVPVAGFLAAQGARVVGYDSKSLEELSAEARALGTAGVELRTGNIEYSRLEEFDLIVLSPGLNVHREPLRGALENAEASGVEIIGEMELAVRHCSAPIIAVTGTKGKSTTTKLIAEMLEACGVHAVRAGNTGTPLTAELPRVSPDDWVVLEVSSFQLERAPRFRPAVGVLLSLLEDHQDYHPSFEQYWATKLKLFANQTAEDVAVFNVDDPRVARLLQQGTEEYALWPQPLRSRIIKSSAASMQHTDMTESDDYGAGFQDGSLGWWLHDEFVPVVELENLPLRGAHNAGNVAAALATVKAALGDKALEHRGEVADAISNFQGLPHRLEIVARKNGITWVNDSQATIPDAAIGALKAFPAPVALIAGGKDKLGDARGYDTLGEAIAAHAHLLLTIGEAAEMIADAARRAGFDNQKIIAAQTLQNAVKQAKMRMPEGSTVVLSPACASFDQFTSFEHRGETFKQLVLGLRV